jgi:hypothetical protein
LRFQIVLTQFLKFDAHLVMLLCSLVDTQRTLLKAFLKSFPNVVLQLWILYRKSDTSYEVRFVLSSACDWLRCSCCLARCQRLIVPMRSSPLSMIQIPPPHPTLPCKCPNSRPFSFLTSGRAQLRDLLVRHVAAQHDAERAHW